MEMSGLISKMVIFVVLMVVGYALSKSGKLGQEFTKAASSLVINVFLCGTIINSVLVVDMELSWAELGNIMLVMCTVMVLCYVVAAVISRLTPIEEEHKPLLELLIAVQNNMFIAMPIVDALFGPTAVFYCSLSCIPYNVIIYTYGVWRLKSGGSKGGIRARDILSMPLLATLAALLIFMTGINVPQVLRELVSAVAGATMPLSMIVIGSSLGTVSIFAAFRRPCMYLLSFVRLIVCPLLVWLVCGFLTDNSVLRMTGTIIAAAPSAVVVTVLTIQYDRDAVFTSEGILHSTVLAMISMPLLVYILG